MAKKYAPTMYLEHGRQLDENHVELQGRALSGAKRVNVGTGEYVDVGDRFMTIMTGIPQKHTTRHTEEGQFFMHGKDDSCLVEGSWYDWLCLVGNVLASNSVKHNYPKLYMP